MRAGLPGGASCLYIPEVDHMPEQLSLFGEENTLLNRGIQRLIEMDFSGCLETLERYGQLFPWGQNVSREIALAVFWRDRLGAATWERIDAAEVERRYGLWLEFEEAFGFPWAEDAIEQKAQVSYFSRLADGLAAEARGLARLRGGTPLGLIYLLAGRADGAITSLQALIASAPEDARAYGYLGDAYTLRGDQRTARICYREAFSLDPFAVDLRRLRDRELREMLSPAAEDDDEEPPSLEWFTVRAQLDGIFDRRILRNMEEVKQWLQRYLDLEQAYRKGAEGALAAQLFYHSMVLSDNAPMLRFIKQVDLAEIRRQMKSWHPAFFARHMRDIEARR